MMRCDIHPKMLFPADNQTVEIVKQMVEEQTAAAQQI